MPQVSAHAHTRDKTVFSAYINAMVTAAVIARENPDRHPRARAGGLFVSAILHIAVAILLLMSPRLVLEPPKREMVVEVVTLPPPPEPEPKREIPPPEPPAPAPELPEARHFPPPPPPQLQEAPLAEQSRPSPTPAPRPARQRPAQAPSAVVPGMPSLGVPTPVAPAPMPNAELSARRQSQPLGNERGGETLEEASQSLDDFILSQVARYWVIDFKGERFRDIVLYARLVLKPDGMLASPYGKNDPWVITSMVPNYDQYTGPQQQQIRTALVTFLQAARQAQPFRLPPDGKSGQMQLLTLEFRLGDIQIR